MKEININDGSISSITKALSENASDYSTIWFRGQPNYEHKLLPSVLRQGKKYNEREMFLEFKRRFPNESVSHKTTYEWLSLMQHYRLPTRLLDWTTNLLVALYFCCNEEKDKDGSLFVLDPTTFFKHDSEFSDFIEMQVTVKNIDDFYHKIIFNKSHILNDETVLNGDSIGNIKNDLRLYSNYCGLSKKRPHQFFELKLKTPINIDENEDEYIYTDILKEFSNIVPFNPPHINPRIKQQHGCFTLHGGMYIDGEEFIKVIPMEEHQYSINSLIKLKISANNKEEILKELKYMGIREATLFPEMEYQAKEIKTLYSQ